MEQQQFTPLPLRVRSVLELIDGERSVGAIVDALAERFGEERGVIEGDVIAMLDDLVTKRVVER